MGCPQWKEVAMEASAEGGLNEAASGAEAATVGASEAAEVVTGEDTALAKWMEGVTADRSGEVVPTKPPPPTSVQRAVCVPLSTLGPAPPFTFYITLLALTLILLIHCVEKCESLFFMFGLFNVTHFINIYKHSLFCSVGPHL